MKCPHCGSPIRLEDKYCSYCGLPNDLATQHQKDMNRYQKKFNQTRFEVLNSTRNTKKKLASFLVLAVMVLLIIASYQFEDVSWRLGRYLTTRQIQSHKTKHLAALETIIADQDPLRFTEYYDRYSLYLSDDFDSYYAMKAISSSFENVFQYVSDRLSDPETYDKDFESRRLRTLASDLNDIFQIEDAYTYHQNLYFSEENLEYIHAVQDDTRAILITYLGLTEEEADTYVNLSSSRQYDLLERSVSAS